MPTETFSVEEAEGITHQEFEVTKPIHLLNEVHEQLRYAAGWTFEEELVATYRLDMPYGLPYTTEPDPPVDKVDISAGVEVATWEEYSGEAFVDRTRFHLYDPYRQNPLSAPEVTWIAMGLSVSETVAAVASAIAGGTELSIVAGSPYLRPAHAGWWVIEFEGTEGTALAPFTLGGERTFTGSPSAYWSVAGYTGGAGWHLSETYESTTLHLFLYAGLPVSSYPAPTFGLIFRFQVGTSGAEIDYPLLSPTPHGTVTYHLVASRYQFWLWNPDYGWANIMAFLPFLWEDKEITTAAIVGGGFMLRDTFVWGGGLVATAVNHVFTSKLPGTTPAFRLPGVCASYNNGPFAYAAGDDLIENAFVMATRDDLDEDEGSRIIGKLWNAFVMRRDATKGEIVSREAEHYLCVARNGTYYAPAASLWIRIV